MLGMGMGGHRSLMMGMVWVCVQIRRKMLGSANHDPINPKSFFLTVLGHICTMGLNCLVSDDYDSVNLHQDAVFHYQNLNNRTNLD
jgi:hypothetical protein